MDRHEERRCGSLEDFIIAGEGHPLPLVALLLPVGSVVVPLSSWKELVWPDSRRIGTGK